MKLNKVNCWNVPCGFHQAIIRDARIIESECPGVDQSYIRLILELTSHLHPLKKYVVKKTYQLGDAVCFIKDMENLLGERCQMLANLSGEVISEALGQHLLGLEVDVEVEHHHGKLHDQPFCLVSQIKPRGSLIELLPGD